MTIQQCKYVLEIARTGSFNEAAKQLFVAQSSLSVNVKSLENEFNIQIFNRSKNGVYLTEEGVEFVRYASAIVEQYNFIENRYNSKDSGNRLNIVTQHYDFIADIFAKMLNALDSSSQSNRYRFSLREIKTYDVIREIETAGADIGIIAIKDSDFDIMKRYLNSKSIEFTSFVKTSPHVFVRQNHPLASFEKLSISDIEIYPYVAYEQGQHNISVFTEELSDEPQSNKLIEISDRATLMNMLLTTNACTIGTGIMPSALNKGDIVSIPLDTEEKYIIGYILNTDKKISATTDSFIDFLVKSVGNIN